MREISEILNTIIHGNVLEVLPTIPDQSVNCIVTSPPYYRLRDYGLPATYWPEVTFKPMALYEYKVTIPEWEGCLGLEPSPIMYVGHLVAIFREAMRVLQDDGTLWLNLGDTYSQRGEGIGGSFESERPGWAGSDMGRKAPEGLKPKNLIGIPWMVAFALQADGWYLRIDNVWEKENCLPESVKDRPTKSHEYIFLLSKNARYYYNSDAIKEPVAESSLKRLEQNIDGQKGSARAHAGGKTNGTMKAVCFGGNKKNGGRTYSGKEWIPTMAAGAPNIESRKHQSADGQPYYVRNKRSVWTISTKPFSEAHFAVFPPDLVEPCILAGSPIGGVILDPFAGSGTTGMVSRNLGRNYVLIELNETYIKEIAEPRIERETRQINLLYGSGGE